MDAMHLRVVHELPTMLQLYVRDADMWICMDAMHLRVVFE